MSSPRSIEKQYLDAVLAGDFARAAAFAQLPWKSARVPLRDRASIELEIELRRSRIDAILGAFEPPKGAWRVMRGDSALLYGVDEWIVTRPDLREDERGLLTKHTIL